MRRTLVITGAVSFAMAFLGTLMASILAVPAVVGAQEARIRAESFTIVGDNGADRIRLVTQPGMNAGVQVADINGVRRSSLNTGRGLVGDAPEAAGLTVWAADGMTPLASLRTGRGPSGDGPLRNNLVLSDWQGQARVVLAVLEDGTPSIRMQDASGNVTWEAK